MTFIIIGIIVVIIIAIISSSRGNSAISENDKTVIREVLSYIESVRLLFVGQSPLNGETIGCFQIIPVNENKEMYRPNSCRVLLMVLLYDEYDWKEQSVLTTAKLNSSPFGAYFHTEIISGNKQFAAYTAGRFSSDYKTFMSHLYNEVNAAYPGKFRFDGSRIMSNDNYGITIF